MTTAEHIADLRGKYRFTMGLMTEAVVTLIEATDVETAIIVANTVGEISNELAVRFIDYKAYVSGVTGHNYYDDLIEVSE